MAAGGAEVRAAAWSVARETREGVAVGERHWAELCVEVKQGLARPHVAGALPTLGWLFIWLASLFS